MSVAVRTILVRFGTFYVYQITRHNEQWIDFCIGHGTYPMDKGKKAWLTKAGNRFRCNACHAQCSPKNAVKLKDALELIQMGLRQG